MPTISQGKTGVPCWTAVVFCIALAGCADGYNPALEGRWRLVDQDYDLVIDLRPDGSYHAETNIGTNSGRWKQVDDEHIATWTDDNQPTRVSSFKIHGDHLTIIDTGKAALEHVRLQ
jgi:hypothetical protein